MASTQVDSTVSIMIRHVLYSDIDKNKWDKCISTASNELIYGYSFYLDAMAGKWNALILNDYEAVMPIPFRKKMGIQYVYQPAFIQQLGVYSIEPVSKILTDAFLQTLMQHYRFAEITLNYSNPAEQNQNYTVQYRNNYVKHMNQPEVAFNISSTYLQKRFRRAKKNNLKYEKFDDYSFIVALYKASYHHRLTDFTGTDFDNFHTICAHESVHNNLIMRVCKKENSVIAAVLLLKSGNRLYNILSCVIEPGKKLLANYFLYGKLIEEFSGKGLILDLEGSDEPGIQFFYKKLSDEHQPYPFVKFNHLPIPLRWFK